jgi:alanine racemase
LPLGLPAALHIDTGMTRLGLDGHDVATLKERAAFARLEIACAVTHFACADERDHPLTEKQLARFEELSAQLPGAPTSIGNSAAVFLGARYCGDLARPGIALYGGNPFSEGKSPVEPVASLLGRVLQIRELHEAASVGYGATYEARKGMRIATVGVGYADGYPRAMGNRGEVSFKGKRLPVVGRVSMDLLTIDVSSVGATDIGVGDYVELFGTEVPVDEVALACDTIDYEILTGLGDRLERVYID